MMWKIFIIKMIDESNTKECEWYFEGTLKEVFTKILMDVGGQAGIVELSIMCYDQ